MLAPVKVQILQTKESLHRNRLLAATAGATACCKGATPAPPGTDLSPPCCRRHGGRALGDYPSSRFSFCGSSFRVSAQQQRGVHLRLPRRRDRRPHLSVGGQLRGVDVKLEDLAPKLLHGERAHGSGAATGDCTSSCRHAGAVVPEPRLGCSARAKA